VGPLADSANYGYVTLNGVDPIWVSYQGIGDFGQPNPATYGGMNGVLPGATETAFPKCENAIWKYGYSFPNVRNGSYRAWSVLRLVYNSASSTQVTNLVTASNKYVVTSIPDYVPFATVSGITSTLCPAPTGGITITSDPGLKVWRSHYQQLDGQNRPLGKAPVNTQTADAGGDMGGAILIYEATLGIGDLTTQLSQGSNANNLSPYARPKN
jgi:hypothetical protein